MIHLGKEKRTYFFSPENPPAVVVEPGETIVFETLDALDDQIHSQEDSADKVNLDHVNGATGPVFVKGAQPGDTLVAEIIGIKPCDSGAALLVPGFGFLQDTLPGPYTRFFNFESDGSVLFDEHIRVPFHPMIGTIGVSPREAVSTLTSGAHGGNLDTTEVAEGSKLFLPVMVAGALFGVGDVHAVMGDGETCGTGIECGANVTIRLDLLKDYPIERPRLETAQEIMTIASAEGLDQAIKLALLDMVLWLQQAHKLSPKDAYILAGICGDVRIGQIVDPAVTVRVAVPKNIFID